MRKIANDDTELTKRWALKYKDDTPIRASMIGKNIEDYGNSGMKRMKWYSHCLCAYGKILESNIDPFADAWISI